MYSSGSSEDKQKLIAHQVQQIKDDRDTDNSRESIGVSEKCEDKYELGIKSALEKLNKCIEEEKEKPEWNDSDENPSEDEQHSGYERVSPSAELQLHLLGQDINAEGFEQAAKNIQTQREGGNLTLVGTSCIANLALLKNLVKSADEIPQLIVLDFNSFVGEFWDGAKLCSEKVEKLEISLCELGETVGTQGYYKANVPDREHFMRVISGSGFANKHEERWNKIIFSCEETVFKSNEEVQTFYKNVLKKAVFIPVDYGKLDCTDCNQIHFTKSLVDKVKTDEVVFYGSNINGSAMGAWVAGLKAKWVIATDLYLGQAPKNCNNMQCPNEGWGPQTLLKALSPDVSAKAEEK
jgi:hypothetical protein